MTRSLLTSFMLVQNKEQIIRRMEDNRSALAALGVHRLGLFGSFVRDQQNGESDVDMLVEFKPGSKSFDNFMGLSFMLEELFGRKVDIVTPESLSPHIGPKILAEVEYGLID